MGYQIAEIQLFGVDLHLLPEKAIYLPASQTLLVSDVHLGKSETFQAAGVPISHQVNQETLDRLQHLCLQLNPKELIILGDLFHSRQALVQPVIDRWLNFFNAISANVQLIIGNHDRRLTSRLEGLSIHCIPDALPLDRLILSHEPIPQKHTLNICGHIHPCVRIKTKLDNLRLPCFYLDKTQNMMILPSFGEFTGGYEMPLKRGAIAYIPTEDAVIPFQR